ncbi:STAS domain-containing protein [Rivularia sp. UHCC 0363]|uniref:STAS domain-containing protein n=1 Tax=Rivularia sp. UHCC 0363 TaxID=3110244 RepID=UPI002B2169D0|nr:STAS domain-containing protein [Rivularia sp. UHCC 0363]MEA5593921.1 STAS domain-containing protein [Rivularia sp. UHCC 0363]
MQAILDNPKITIVRPQESLNAVNAVKLEQELDAALSQVSNTIVLLDLEKVDLIDSAGLMALVSGVKKAKQLEQRLCFCSVSPSHRIIFELTQLDKVFEIFENNKILSS